MSENEDSPALQLQGKISYKGSEDYEGLRQQAIFNAKKPDRYPAAILMAESEADVIAGVKLAKSQGWQVGVRSGGHSWVAPHTRDNALLINMSRMQELVVDPAKRTACVSPGVNSQTLMAALYEHGLMFPGGHNSSVAVGGFLLSGGHGWNSRTWGPACANLSALDVVTADGELIHASETENSDYLWAARGSAAGFPGVAVRFYLKAYPWPSVMKSSAYAYPVDSAEPLVAWLRDICETLPTSLEIALMRSGGEPDLTLVAIGFSDSEQELDAALDLLDGCPVRGQAKVLAHKTPAQILPLPAAPGHSPSPDMRPYTGDPALLDMNRVRYEVDGMWTSAGASEIAPFMPAYFSDYPTPQSMSALIVWGAVQKLPDMAYSVQGSLYFVSSGCSLDPADDQRCAAWAVNSVKRMEALSAGSQMNDDNMVGHRQRYFSDAAAAKLEHVREKYDPQHRFVSFLEAEPGGPAG